MLPVIALVGRPNVGKSTLFNRLTKTRDALVASFPGLTRDRQYGKGVVGDFDYVVVDTGGLTGDENGIDKPMAEQAMFAISECDLVLFVVDSKDGRVVGDEAIAHTLRIEGVPTLLVANKIDGQNQDYVAGEFFSLGFGEPAYVSATSGHGITRFFNERVATHDAIQVDQPRETDPGSGIKIAVVGRPNVGKSTLVNRMLGEDRVVVFDEAGTTRDSIYIPYERDGKQYTIIDTAGVRRRGKVKQAIETFSIIKTLDAISNANVVILMIDAREGIVDQDLHLLGHVLQDGRALVLAVNKWDGTSQDQKDHVKTELERRLTFINFAKSHFISALHGSGVGNLYDSIHKAYESATRKIQTHELNDILKAAITEHQPPLVKGRRIKLRYAHLGGNNPPVIVIHGNQTDSVPESYKRFLQHKFTRALKFEGTPVRIEFRSGDNPYEGRKNKLSKRQVEHKQRLFTHVKKGEKKRKK